MAKPRRIAIGSDHGGFDLKEVLKRDLESKNHHVIDCGTTGREAVDYPVFAAAVANKIAVGEVEFGVIIDGAGIGSAMVANKIKGVRAAMCYDVSTASNAREHNDANVLTLGAGLIGANLAKEILETFLSKSCSAERHLRRVGMINELDRSGDSAKVSSPITKPESNLIEISSEDLARIVAKIGKNMDSSESSISASQCGSDMVCRCGMCADRDPATLRKFLDYGVERIGFHNATGCECVPEDVARCIDHTLLKPDATEADVKKLCAEAGQYKFASVCISPCFVSLAAKELTSTSVRVCTVVGFPSGAHVAEIKAMEARWAIRSGAGEIDMVINIGALKSGNDDLVYRDIRQVCEACEDGNAISKVIIEAAYLTDDEKIRACELARRARANYVKTSTGFGPHGATAEDVALMNSVVKGAGIGVKAAGGIRTYKDAQEMIAAGATRIGASAGIKILQEAKSVTISN